MTTASFTSVSKSPDILVDSGTTLRYSLSGTFSATMQLVYSVSGGNTWTVLVQSTTATSGSVILETPSRDRALVAWRCVAYTSGTASTEILVVQDSDELAASAAPTGLSEGELASLYGSAKYPKLIADSTAAAGANVLAIQAALDAGGICNISVPGTYYYTGPVIQPSNSTLIIGPGVTMKLTGGTRLNFIRNAAQSVTPKTISALSYSAGVCTATCTSHGYAVGDWVSVAWAAESGYNGVFKVATAADANTFTYYPEIIPSATPATISATASTFNPSVIQVRAADVNIRLINSGVIDQDRGVNTGSTANGNDNHSVIYGHVHNPAIHGDGFIKNTNKYGCFIYAARSVDVRDIAFDTYSDGVHILGPIHGATVRNAHGVTGDNMVALGTGDYAAYHASEGDLYDCKIYDTRPSRMAITPIRCFGSSNFKAYITFDGLSGKGTNVPGIQLFVDPLVMPNGNFAATDIRVKNIDYDSGTAAAVSCAPATADSIEIDGVLFRGSGNGVSVGSGSAAYTYKRVVVEGVRNLDPVNQSASKNVVVGTQTTIDTLILDNCQMEHNQVASGRLLELDGTVGRCIVRNPKAYQGSSIVNILSTLAAACDITIEAPAVFDTNYVVNNASTQSINASVIGGTVRDTAAVFRHAGASGTLRCRTAGPHLENNTAIIARTASQTIEAYGWEISADVDLLATTNGQYMRNTDATSTAGIAAGLARCEGAAWALV